MESEIYLALLVATTGAVAKLWWQQNVMRSDAEKKQSQLTAELRETTQKHHQCELNVSRLEGKIGVLKKAIQDLERLHFGDQVSASDIIVTSDETSLITGWSAGAAILFGWSATEAIGKSISALIVPEDIRDEHDAAISHIVSSNRTEVQHRIKETRGLRKGGEEFGADIELKGRKSVLGGWQFTAKFFPKIIQEQTV